VPLCLIGDSGTGKSHLLIALGTEGAMAGYWVKYTLATKPVNELVEAADDKQLATTIARYGRVDLLCIDELGYMALDRRGAELLFQVLTEREERSSVAIASRGGGAGLARGQSGGGFADDAAVHPDGHPAWGEPGDGAQAPVRHDRGVPGLQGVDGLPDGGGHR
jgi:IstB-like ATP binding protein